MRGYRVDMNRYLALQRLADGAIEAGQRTLNIHVSDVWNLVRIAQIVCEYGEALLDAADHEDDDTEVNVANALCDVQEMAEWLAKGIR